MLRLGGQTQVRIQFFDVCISIYLYISPVLLGGIKKVTSIGKKFMQNYDPW